MCPRTGPQGKRMMGTWLPGRGQHTVVSRPCHPPLSLASQGGSHADPTHQTNCRAGAGVHTVDLGGRRMGRSRLPSPFCLGRVLKDQSGIGREKGARGAGDLRGVGIRHGKAYGAKSHPPTSGVSLRGQASALQEAPPLGPAPCTGSGQQPLARCPQQGEGKVSSERASACLSSHPAQPWCQQSGSSPAPRATAAALAWVRLETLTPSLQL